MKILIKSLLIIFILITVAAQPQELIWEHTGGPMGGVVGGLDINSFGDIYAGTYPLLQNGLFKSTDNGNSWNKVDTQFSEFSVYSIYITKEDHIWVGTDFQDRIYLSTDNGETWEIKSNGYSTNECWAFGESNDDVLFAGDGQYNRLYRSTNYGDNWTLSANLRPLAFVTDSNNTVYAGTFTGLYKTSDNGLSWVQDNLLQNLPIASILIDERNNIYCGTGYYDSGDGVYYSDDGGQSWTRIGLPGMVVLSLAFDSEGNLFAGTQTDGVYKTTDLGQSWQQYQKGLHKKAVIRLKINKQDDIFIGSEGENLWGFYEGGVFRSTNGGNSFEQVGLPISLVKNFVFSGDSLILAATPSGVQKYNRIKKKWSNIGLNRVEAISITPSNYLYAATREEGLFKSTDLGESWELTNLTADTLMPVYNILAINDDTLFASTFYNLRRSFDGGENWKVLSLITGDNSRGLFFNNNIIWITGYISNNRFLFNSIDLGNSFAELFSGFRTWDYNNPIFITANNSVFLASRDNVFNGIFKSKDSGQNWEQVLFEDNISPTIFADDDGVVITGTVVFLLSDTNKVYLSYDYGSSWKSIPQPTRFGASITDIKRDSQGNFFFATATSGLYKVELITSVIEEDIIPDNFILFQNYPNPFNPITKISWQSPAGSHQTLKVYDVLGREVATLVNEYRPVGKYEVEFNAKELTSGIYFYTLTSGNFTATKKLILLK
jgi:photosystem II stability/assembly factor-like uncharacterized protein